MSHLNNSVTAAARTLLDTNHHLCDVFHKPLALLLSLTSLPLKTTTRTTPWTLLIHLRHLFPTAPFRFRSRTRTSRGCTKYLSTPRFQIVTVRSIWPCTTGGSLLCGSSSIIRRVCSPRRAETWLRNEVYTHLGLPFPFCLTHQSIRHAHHDPIRQ